MSVYESNAILKQIDKQEFSHTEHMLEHKWKSNLRHLLEQVFCDSMQQNKYITTKKQNAYIFKCPKQPKWIEERERERDETLVSSNLLLLH